MINFSFSLSVRLFVNSTSGVHRSLLYASDCTSDTEKKKLNNKKNSQRPDRVWLHLVCSRTPVVNASCRKTPISRSAHTTPPCKTRFPTVLPVMNALPNLVPPSEHPLENPVGTRLTNLQGLPSDPISQFVPAPDRLLCSPPNIDSD